MKTILVSSRVIDVAEYDEQRIALDIRWGDLAKELGILLVPIVGLRQATAAFDGLRVDGILLSGGNNPAAVDEAVPAEELRSCDRLRWETDRVLIDAAEARSIPVLGVCGGMQSLAKYFGLKLVKRAGHVKTRHSLRPGEPNEYTSIVEGNRTVNSFHDYVVVGNSRELVPCAIAEDGSVEAFAHVSKPIVGVMWHPEREADAVEADMLLIRRLYGLEIS